MSKIFVGAPTTLQTVFSIEGVPQDATGAVSCSVFDPTGAETDAYQTHGSHPAVGTYQAIFVPTLPGIHRFRWFINGQAADEGTFDVESTISNPVTDLRDLRVLVPACRRAIDGPQATAQDAPSSTLADDEVLGLLADATGELILHTASADGTAQNAFGNSLVVAARDPYYMAPVSWATEVQRSTAQDAAILSQAALNHYFWLIRTIKTSEAIKDEGSEWQYSLSANVIAAWMNYLMQNRDKAISALQSMNVVMDVYISLVAERDRMAAAWLEPWVAEIGAPVPYAGGGGSGPLEYDFRFNSWG